MNPLSDIVTGSMNGLREVAANKVRTLLSMSGIILGVAALVTMVGIVQGMLSNMRVSFEADGGILKIEVDKKDLDEDQQHLAGLSPGLTWRDIIALEQATHLAPYISPIVHIGWERLAANGRPTRAPVYAVSPDFISIQPREIKHGRFISDMDILNKSPVMVVGSYIVERLFNDAENVVGEQIRLNKQVYTIIGQTEELVSMMGGRNTLRRKNRGVFIPATTGMSRYQGNDSVSKIELLARDVDAMPDLIAQVDNVLSKTHRGIMDYEILTQDERMQEMRKLENSFTYSLGGIAAISLLVGGIGIMNVMLASVSERIREIGVRKAIGARSHDISLQFLAEAVVISVLGGLFGLVCSIGLLSIARNMIPNGEAINVFPFTAMIFGFIFSSTVGLLSGIYPALRAGRLDPIDALRYE
ncbi:MAG: ABC transporter permease [Verrucomicrobiota bacterium]